MKRRRLANGLTRFNLSNLPQDLILTSPPTNQIVPLLNAGALGSNRPFYLVDYFYQNVWESEEEHLCRSLVPGLALPPLTPKVASKLNEQLVFE